MNRNLKYLRDVRAAVVCKLAELKKALDLKATVVERITRIQSDLANLNMAHYPAGSPPFKCPYENYYLMTPFSNEDQKYFVKILEAPLVAKQKNCCIASSTWLKGLLATSSVTARTNR